MKPTIETKAGTGCSLERMVRRLNVDELTRLAFVWAEQDRAAMADAWPYGSDEHEEAKSEYQQLKAYRLKRWGPNSNGGDTFKANENEPAVN
jgi:hypothetical protein